MRKRKNIITVAIDSPAAAGAAHKQLISKFYNLYYLDTGKIYRYLGKLKLDNKKNLITILLKK